MKAVHQRLAMKLKQCRKARGLTQGELAAKVGLSLGYVARLEIGMHDPPLSTLAKLAKALGVKLEALVK
jgi:transcriptional regulator with XRE-family HTH domain